MNSDGGRAKEGGVQYEGHCSVYINLSSGELKGRDVSEGLIGSDTIGEISGLLRVPSSISYRASKCQGMQTEVSSESEEEKPDD